jgi:hypothetical protein
MVSLSEFEYQELVRKQAVKQWGKMKSDYHPEEKDDKPESKIQDQIREHCRLKGWYCRGAVFGKKARDIYPGSSDLVIRTEIADYHVEVKRAGGKLSLEQQAAMAHLKRLNGKAVVVHSFDEFLKEVK